MKSTEQELLQVAIHLSFDEMLTAWNGAARPPTFTPTTWELCDFMWREIADVVEEMFGHCGSADVDERAPLTVVRLSLTLPEATAFVLRCSDTYRIEVLP